MNIRTSRRDQALRATRIVSGFTFLTLWLLKWRKPGRI